MAKRNSDGDVLLNRLAVGVAQEQKFLAVFFGEEEQVEPRNEQPDAASENEDLTFTGDYEQFGVGAKVPEEIENGTFTSRVPTTDNKLLEQLIGKKAAKAHLEAKQASKNNTKQPGQKLSRPQAPPKKEDSEDEEEGRASAFKSKKRKVTKTKPINPGMQDSETDDGVVGSLPSPPSQSNTSKQDDGQRVEDSSDADNRTKTIPKSTYRPSKPASFLDQLLAERSKKKKKKPKFKADA